MFSNHISPPGIQGWDKSLGMKELDEVFDRWSAPPAPTGMWKCSKPRNFDWRLMPWT